MRTSMEFGGGVEGPVRPWARYGLGGRMAPKAVAGANPRQAGESVVCSWSSVTAGMCVCVRTSTSIEDGGNAGCARGKDATKSPGRSLIISEPQSRFRPRGSVAELERGRGATVQPGPQAQSGLVSSRSTAPRAARGQCWMLAAGALRAGRALEAGVWKLEAACGAVER